MNKRGKALRGHTWVKTLFLIASAPINHYIIYTIITIIITALSPWATFLLVSNVIFNLICSSLNWWKWFTVYRDIYKNRIVILSRCFTFVITAHGELVSRKHSARARRYVSTRDRMAALKGNERLHCRILLWRTKALLGWSSCAVLFSSWCSEDQSDSRALSRSSEHSAYKWL